MIENSITILYLHGFLGSGQSEKSQWLNRRAHGQILNHDIEWLSPTYPQKNPDASMQFLENWIQTRILKKHQAWLIMGSSMGGFIGQYFADRYQVPLVLFNPALHPARLFSQYLGQHTNPFTDEKLVMTPEYLDRLMQYDRPAIQSSPVLLLQDKEDEVVPYQWAYDKYQSIAHTKLYEGGNHRFMHLEQAWPHIQVTIENCAQA